MNNYNSEHKKERSYLIFDLVFLGILKRNIVLSKTSLALPVL